MIVLYGLGTTIGAGIYALTGKVAADAGMAAPLSFVIAAGLAGFTAFSFAELASRHPRSAGVAVYVRHGFGWSAGAVVVGLLVVLSAIVSAAVLVAGFAGYLAELVATPKSVSIALCALILGAIAVWGITQSALIAAVITLLEIGGLLLVTWAARGALLELPGRLDEFAAIGEISAWRGILSGSILAFYAFIGFEDMVHVAEEVRDVRRNLPRAIVVVLVLTTLIYLVLALACVLAVPPAELAESDAPLALVYESGSGRSATVLSVIAATAMLNGALIQVIMASRILFGLSDDGPLPPVFGRVHPRTRTPVFATVSVTALVLVLALLFPLVALAETTSVITLAVFALVNAALWRLKRLEPHPPDAWLIPRGVPIAGFAVSAFFLAVEATHRLSG
ncbi:MAG: amino acid permease [Deltaproteobacteria bacterium]|nr:amino acid permease [Deltaproteobacteria bacterium]